MADGPPPGDTGEYPRSSNGMGIAAAVCGVLAVAICWIPFVDYLSLVLGALAMVFGSLGIRQANAFPGAGKGLAITGIAFGIVGFAIAAIVLLLIYTLLAAATNAPAYG